MKYYLFSLLSLSIGSAVAAQSLDTRILEFDFPALRIGTAEYEDGPTGTTVFYFPEPVKGAIDVRGGSPGTVNATVLQNGDEEYQVDAVIFSGGSWYGLSAATGAANAIKELKAGEGDRDYIAGVIGAIVYDVGARRFTRMTPDHDLGAKALREAVTGRFPLGAHGGGRFTMQGWYFGPYYHPGGQPDAPFSVHSGQGGAFRQIGPTKIAVFTVVNALGSVVDRDGRVVRCHRNDASVECPLIADRIEKTVGETVQSVDSGGGKTTNTTITLVVTNQRLDFALLRRLAMQVHTSMGRAIQPLATRDDGDVLVAVTTDEVDNPALSPVELGVIASEVAWDAVLSSVPELPTLPVLSTVAPNAAVLTSYTGTYAFPGDSRLTISLRNDNLSADYRGAENLYFKEGRTYTLLPAQDELFVVDGPAQDVIRFDRDGEVVSGITLNPGPWPQVAERVP